jgi:hypothetical protein
MSTATVTEYRAPRAFRDNKSGVYVSGVILPRDQKRLGKARLAALVEDGRVIATSVAAETGEAVAPAAASRTAAATAARVANARKKKSTRRGKAAASDSTGTGAADK